MRKKQWKIKLIHHTHFDIGYTHTQQEVLDLQFLNQNEAMNLIDANRNRAGDAQFRWNPEATWALKKWLNSADKRQKERFISMVQSGHIGLDALFANMHTALCRPEELIRMMDGKRELEELTTVPIDSAMITDVPGWNWGMVPALYEEGIRYLSAGTNHGDRIGHTIKTWGDKPFYWISPSGKEKILLWVHGKGYAWFHTALNKRDKLRNKLRYPRIKRYLSSLEKSGYPYNTVLIRYNIGSDNGPPDRNVSRIVEEWNKNHMDIQLELTTSSKAMADFEAEYGDSIPEYRGDLTAYWEDGALSTARETAIAREASERLIQGGTISVMTGKKSDSPEVSRTWEEVLLFNEHTWGAHNSISKPDHPFAKSQWAWKGQRALNGEAGTLNVLEKATGMVADLSSFYSTILNQEKLKEKQNESRRVTLYNSNSWEVSRLVEISTKYNSVYDKEGKSVPAQRLSNGQLVFYAASIPPLGSCVYTLSDKETQQFKGACSLEKGVLSNDRLSCSIDMNTGHIRSIRLEGIEYVDTNSKEGFNSFVLVPGKFPSLRKFEDTGKSLSIELVDKGPLRATVRIRRKAARCNEYITEISLDAWSDEIRIHNILDRPSTRRKEGLHFAFPMEIPGGELRYDSAWGTVSLEKDQLPGANRNFITASRWLDVSGPKTGMSCVLIDAPIFKSGNLVHDPIRTGPPKLCGWLEKTEYNGKFYSYVMNNYWQTNFKADQPGRTLFRYVFRPHGKYTAEENYRSALENMQPLLCVNGEGSSVITLPLPSDKRIILSSAANNADYISLRLVNISGETAETTLFLSGNELKDKQFTMGGMGKESCKQANRISLEPGETALVNVITKMDQKKGEE